MFEEARGDLMSGTVGGVGLDSSERGFPPELFETVYRSAKEAGIRRTAHAGEEGGPESVRGALECLDVERIDHGIRIAEDEALMAEVVGKGHLVTVCPLSNVRLQCVKAVKELPIRTFLDKGVKFSINSDDPAYFGGYILDNYCAVQEAFGLSVMEWKGVTTAAVQGSWCGEERKKEMMDMLNGVLKKYEGVK